MRGSKDKPSHITESKWVQYSLITLVILFLSLVLIVPLVSIFSEALSKGRELYLAALSEPEAIAAIKLTLLTAFIVVPLNVVIGVAIAWLLTRYDFRGKQLFTTLLDLPFAVSPVVAGLMFVLLFGAHSIFGSWLESQGIQIIFAIPGIVLATLFVTFPFIAREIMPLMQSQGEQEEQAALILGASGWKMFWKITLPNIKWALLYGIMLTNARAMGEFGAVSVVSGHIRGLTNTIPLQVEILYNEYNFVGAFAMASLLAVLALVTLVLQHIFSYFQYQKYHLNKESAALTREISLSTVITEQNTSNKDYQPVLVN